MKQCNKCGEWKEEVKFVKDRGVCRSCNCELLRLWRVNNPEKSREYARRYRAEHPEKSREQCHRYYANHIEKSREKTRRYRAEHPEKSLEYALRWRAKNPYKARESDSRYRALSYLAPFEFRFLLPPDLIQLRLLQLELKRELRKLSEVSHG